MTRPATILFLGANPSDTTRLALDREVREIDQRLRASEHRDAFRIEQAWAVRATDLQERLLRHRPSIVHFSGHGNPAGELLLEDETGQGRSVMTTALRSLFRALRGGIRAVVLNACFSEAQARAIVEHVDCVVGMTTAIADFSAIAFAGAFYQALGYGHDVQTAFDLGCGQLHLTGLGETDVPRLIARHGVRAQDVRFIGATDGPHTVDTIQRTQTQPSRSTGPTPGLNRKVLWVEDDRFALSSMTFWLTDRGYDVICANTPTEAIRVLRSEPRSVGCAIIDLYLPGRSSAFEPSGLRLARSLKKEWPEIPLICLSNVVSTPAVEWFRAHGAGYYHKHDLGSSMRLFMRTIDEVMGRKLPPSTLIVHGRADRLLMELKGYLIDELGWSDVHILKEIPSRRRSVVEKFSEEATGAELIFVLLSSEDVTFASADQDGILRGKADLVFELGYILGSSKRRSCKVVVLTTASAVLPPWVGSAAVIDASAGFQPIRDEVRLEIEEWIG